LGGAILGKNVELFKKSAPIENYLLHKFAIPGFD
jgi:hypothetical protein